MVEVPLHFVVMILAGLLLHVVFHQRLEVHMECHWSPNISRVSILGATLPLKSAVVFFQSHHPTVFVTTESTMSLSLLKWYSKQSICSSESSAKAGPKLWRKKVNHIEMLKLWGLARNAKGTSTYNGFRIVCRQRRRKVQDGGRQQSFSEGRPGEWLSPWVLIATYQWGVGSRRFPGNDPG